MIGPIERPDAEPLTDAERLSLAEGRVAEMEADIAGLRAMVARLARQVAVATRTEP